MSELKMLPDRQVRLLDEIMQFEEQFTDNAIKRENTAISKKH